MNIADYAISTLGETPTTWEEFASFSVNVLGPERTLFEKLAAVHDAASRNDEEALFKHGRHFYDIHQLLQDERVVGSLESLGSEGINDLVEDIEHQSNSAGSHPRPAPCKVIPTVQRSIRVTLHMMSSKKDTPLHKHSSMAHGYR